MPIVNKHYENGEELFSDDFADESHATSVEPVD